MEKEYIQVSFENGNIERKSYPAGIRLLDLAKEYQKEDDIVLAKVNGRLRELYLQLTEDCRISFITTRQQEGMAAYRRSMTLLLLKALYHQAGHEHIRRVGIHFSVSSRRTIGSATADIPTIAGKITNSPIVCARLSIARTCFLSSCACAMTGNMTDCTAVSRLRDTVVEKRCPRS